MRFDTVLIANRGEIAVRIIRACREQNLGCVSVYSTADRNALHVKFADRAVCIGAPATADSYLRMDSIIEACRQTGATAVHPGFGFLSENAEFAKLCRENDITFIGPSPECIAMLGDKAQAKETMKAAGVPVIPGSECITLHRRGKGNCKENRVSGTRQGICWRWRSGYPASRQRGTAGRTAARCTGRGKEVLRR